jgi:iron complex outermembrane recepter protein
LLLRGSIGKGFRAPSLGEAFAPPFLGTSANVKDPVTGTSAQWPELFGGNAHLRPEKSTQDSFGFVLEPIKNVSLSVDYFAVRIENSIGSLSVADALGLAKAGNPIAVPLVHRDVAGNIVEVDTTNVNLGNLAASGVELNMRWRSPDFFFGRITTTLTGTYMDRYDQTLPDGTVEGCVAQTVTVSTGNTLSCIGNNGGIIQRWRHNLDINLDKNDWSFTATQHFQGSYGDFLDNFGNQHQVGAFSTWDAQVAEQFTKQLRWSLGVKNLFDRNPPEAAYGLFFQTGYDPTYYDARARFVYGTLSYKFL